MEFRKKIRAYDSATTTRVPAAPIAIGACCARPRSSEEEQQHGKAKNFQDKYPHKYFVCLLRKRVLQLPRTDAERPADRAWCTKRKRWPTVELHGPRVEISALMVFKTRAQEYFSVRHEGRGRQAEDVSSRPQVRSPLAKSRIRSCPRQS